jgi:hypothetical protein
METASWLEYFKGHRPNFYGNVKSVTNNMFDYELVSFQNSYRYKYEKNVNAPWKLIELI